INCPLGCILTVSLDDNGEVADVTGNQCARGVAYARMESTNPTRMMTSTVRLTGGAIGQAPVKTAAPIPKGLVVDSVKALKPVELTAPVTLGQVVLANVCGTGVDVIATRSIPRGKAD
ncbi:MAG: DUF1667 domain-containing protein, partial [Planctomycetaceae bacterium]|nr:DUF1667 domain-containing protein [Planctomycetaceae bacterium]